MQFTITYVPEGTQVSKATSKLDHKLSTSTPLKEQIEEIVKKFTEAGVKLEDDKEHFALYPPGAQACLTDDGIAPLIEETERSGSEAVLLFFQHPSQRAQRVLAGLADGKKVKGVAFKLKALLAETVFATAFVKENGIPALLDVISTTSGNTQSYCLAALSIVVGYEDAMEVLVGAPQLMRQLVHMVDSPVVAVQRLSLELLHTIASGKGRGGLLISEVIEESAKEDKVEPYASLVALLDSGDLDTKTNSMTLLNDIMTSATSENRVKLREQFEKLGMREILKRNLDITNDAFKQQLQTYEKVTGTTILEVTRDDLVRQVRQYELQQPLVKLMRDEIMRAKDAIREAEQNDVYISYRAPLRRYLDRRINIEEKIKGPVRLDLVFSGNTRGGTRQETLETKGVRQLLDMKNKECKGLKDEIKQLTGQIQVFEEQRSKLEAREEMMGLLEAEISSKSLADDQDDSEYVDALPGQTVYILTFDSAKALKIERIQSWVTVMQYRASKPGQKVLLAATHIDELPRDKEKREMVLTKLSALIEKLMKQWVINYADVVEVKDNEKEGDGDKVDASELADAQMRISQLEAALANASTEKKQSNALHEAEEKLQMALAELAEFKKRQLELESEVEQEKKSKDEALDKVKYLLGVSKKVMEKMEALKKGEDSGHSENLSEQKAALEKDRADLAAAKSALAKKQSLIQQERQELATAKAAFEEERASAPAAGAEVSEEIQRLKDELELEREVLKEERALMEEEFGAASVEGGIDHEAHAAVQSELKQLKKALEEEQMKRSSLQQELEAAQAKLAGAENDAAELLEEKMGELELEREVLEQERVLLEEELDNDRVELEAAQRLAAQATEKARKAEAELAAAKQQLDSERVEFELSKAMGDDGEDSSEIAVLKEELQVERELLEQERLAVKGELDEAKTKLEIYEAALTEATEKLKEAKEGGLSPDDVAEEVAKAVAESEARAGQILEALESTENDLAEAQANLEEAEETQKKLSTINARLKSELEAKAEAASEASELRERLESTAKELEEAQRKLEKAEGGALDGQKGLEDAVAAAKEQVTVAETRIAEHEKTIASLQQELDGLKSAAASREKSLSAEAGEHASALSSATEKLEAAEARIKILEADVVALKEEAELMAQEKAVVEEEQTRDAESLVVLSEELELKEQEWQLQRDELTDRVVELERELELAKAAPAEDGVDVAALQRDKEAAIARVGEVEALLESATKDRELLLQETEALRKQSDGVLGDGDLEKRVSRLQRIMLQSMSGKKEAEAKLKALQQKMNG